MKYFSDVRIESKGKKRRLFCMLEDPGNGEVPEFNQKILRENSQYKIFVSETHARIVEVVYSVYSTEQDVANNTQDDVFAKIIDDEDAKYIAGSDFTLDVRSKVVRNTKKSNFNLKVALLIGIPIVAVAGVGIGIKYGYQKLAESMAKENNNIVDDTAQSVDGLMIPVVDNDHDPDAEQVTISIDRSYAAIPTEDLLLKGDVDDKTGVAEITLPEFDHEDFFSHVPGYTFGFSTVQDSDRIEYYGGQTYKFDKDTKLYRVLVKYGGGTGTKEDPYLINYYDQLELMAEEKARGYFRQTCDIEFPDWAMHTSIDTVNEMKEKDPEKERFEYDGGGYAIRGLRTPLFGKVSGALISNVNIQDVYILNPAYKNYGILVCESYNYQFEDVNKKKYETGETIIRNCTVARATIDVDYPSTIDSEVTPEVVTAHEVIAPEALEYDDKGNPITTVPTSAPKPTHSADFAIGAISGLGGQIENCYVENFTVSCDIGTYFAYVGGISGKPASVTDSAVKDLKLSGRIFSCGGIVGSAAGAKKYGTNGEALQDNYGGNIQGCAVITAEMDSEFATGGIAGESSSKTPNRLISNCYSCGLTMSSGVKSEGAIVNSGYLGGIIGSDGQEFNGHTVINCVSPADYKIIGNASKSKFDKSNRLAPPYAFLQDTILSVLNLNSVSPDNPDVIFTGEFIADNKLMYSNSDGTVVEGTLAYPAKLKDLIDRTKTYEED